MKSAGIVLAAGAATRMGTNKMLLQLDGETLIHRAARTALEAGLEPVVVVIGHEPAAARDAVRDLPVRTVLNPAYAGPGAASLHRGLDRLDAAVEGAMIILADMVLVTPEMLRALRDTAERHDAPAVASRYGDIVAPPFLFCRALFPQLRATGGRGLGRSVVERLGAAVHYIDWPPARLADVDTPEDWDALRRARQE